MIDNMAFMCCAQATEGDFTAGRIKLNQVAQFLAYNWIYSGINPNDEGVVQQACQRFGFNFNILLSEEVDYLAKKVEEEIRLYGAT